MVGLVTTDTTRNEIERQDTKQKIDTENMISLRSKAGVLVGLCKDDVAKKQVQSLSDEFRFSDPVSNDAVKGLEAELDVMIDEIQQALIEGNNEAVSEFCDRTKALLAERNRLCKLNKQ